GAAPTIACKTGRGEVATNRQIAGEATARAESLAREIQLFEDRCRRVGQRIEDGILHFVGGVDMAYDAAISLGLNEGAGDDAVQAMLARASIRPDMPQMTTRSDALSRGAGPPLLSIDESRAEKRCTEQDRRWRRIDEELDRQRKAGRPPLA